MMKVVRCLDGVAEYGEKHVLGNIHPYNILLNAEGDIRIVVSNFSFSLPQQDDNLQ